MAVVNTYVVVYHFENSGKRGGGDSYRDYIQAADSNYNTLKAVLSSNTKLRPGTMVIDSVQEVGHGDNVLA